MAEPGLGSEPSAAETGHRRPVWQLDELKKRFDQAAVSRLARLGLQ